MAIQFDDQEDWEYNVLDESCGVKLVEIGVGVYLVVYLDNGCQNAPVFFSWPAAQANYYQRVSEVEYL